MSSSTLEIKQRQEDFCTLTVPWIKIAMLSLFAYFLFSFILTFIIIAAAYFINAPSNDYEKHSAYECGFEPFGDARSFFDIHFYTVGLLFIIFDLEVVFLIPFVVNLSVLPLVGYLTMLFFMAIVIVGFYYEWAIGLLEWLPKKAVYSINEHRAS